MALGSEGVCRHTPGVRTRIWGWGSVLRQGSQGPAVTKMSDEDTSRIPEPLGQGKRVVSDDVVETEEFSVIWGWTEQIRSTKMENEWMRCPC